MPVDASIPLQVRGLELNSPLDRYAKFEGIKNAQSQNRLADLAYGQKSKEIEQENMLAKLLSDNTNPDGSQNREGVIAGLKQLGRGDLIGQAQTGYSAQDEAKAKADIAKIDGLLKQTSAASQLLSGATPENYTQVVQQVEQVMPGSSKNMPPAYDKGAIDAIILKGVPIKDQLEARKAELAAKIAQDNAAWDRQHKTATLEEFRRRTDVMSGDHHAALATKPGAEASDKPMPPAALKLQTEALEAIGTASGTQANIAAFESQLAAGKLDFGPVSNLVNAGRNAAGLSTEESRNFASFKSSLEKMRNDSLRLNSGVQTDGDAQRAWNELFASITDKGVVAQRLSEIKRLNEQAVRLQKAKVNSVRANYGNGPIDTSSFEDVSPSFGSADDIFSQADAILGGM